MKKNNLDLKINEEDLKILYLKTRFAYGNISFDNWNIDCLNSYKSFAENKTKVITYSQWVNGQILSLN